MSTATIRYWAAARDAAGTAEESYEAATLAEMLDHARDRHGFDERFVAVLSYCSFLVDGTPVGARSTGSVELRDGMTVEALPPFAGGC
ncbi:MAG: MoaD/ThiS family protein [Streptosporangiales bacterium]|nr:MoaD/ThiS family protein [Streptosporangiales bacterium]